MSITTRTPRAAPRTLSAFTLRPQLSHITAMLASLVDRSIVRTYESNRETGIIIPASSLTHPCLLPSPAAGVESRVCGTHSPRVFSSWSTEQAGLSACLCLSGALPCLL